MKHIRLQKDRFYISVIAVMFCVHSLSLTLLYFLGNSYQEAVYSSLAILVYFGGIVLIPLLLLRFLYYLIIMFRCGLKGGVKVLSVKTLYNPLNILLFPSLLNEQGVTCRRRCLVALILCGLTIALVFYLVNILQH